MLVAPRLIGRSGNRLGGLLRLWSGGKTEADKHKDRAAELA